MPAAFGMTTIPLHLACQTGSDENSSEIPNYINMFYNLGECKYLRRIGQLDVGYSCRKQKRSG